MVSGSVVGNLPTHYSLVLAQFQGCYDVVGNVVLARTENCCGYGLRSVRALATWIIDGVEIVVAFVSGRHQTVDCYHQLPWSYLVGLIVAGLSAVADDESSPGDDSVICS